VGSPY